MNRFAHSALAICFAVTLSLASIGAIVTVPPAQAEAPVVLPMPVLA